MKVSVIVPTYRRPKQLLKTLESLNLQNFSGFELLIVDNEGSAATEEIVASWNQNAVHKARYISHPEGGSSEARHRGVQEATGDLLLFTDDDLTFEPDWIAAYHQKFLQYPQMLAAGGCVRPSWEVTPPEWLVRYIGDKRDFGIFALKNTYDTFQLDPKNIFYSCNMALRAEIFEWTGLRPELYGTRTLGNGESGLNLELTEKEIPIGYLPDAIAYHQIPELRMSVDYICRWAWHLGGAVMFQFWNKEKPTFSKIVKEAFKIICDHWKIWKIARAVRGATGVEAINIQFRASLAKCKLSYLGWMLTDPFLKDLLKRTDFRPEKITRSEKLPSDQPVQKAI